MFGIGLEEIGLVILFALIFFGANRLPDIGRSLGDALRDRKREGPGQDRDESPEDRLP